MSIPSEPVPQQAEPRFTDAQFLAAAAGEITPGLRESSASATAGLHPMTPDRTTLPAFRRALADRYLIQLYQFDWGALDRLWHRWCAQDGLPVVRIEKLPFNATARLTIQPSSPAWRFAPTGIRRLVAACEHLDAIGERWHFSWFGNAVDGIPLAHARGLAARWVDIGRDPASVRQFAEYPENTHEKPKLPDLDPAPLMGDGG